MSLSPGRKEAVTYRSHSGGLWEGSLQRGSPTGQWLLLASISPSVAQLWREGQEHNERSLSWLLSAGTDPQEEAAFLGVARASAAAQQCAGRGRDPRDMLT